MFRVTENAQTRVTELFTRSSLASDATALQSFSVSVALDGSNLRNNAHLNSADYVSFNDLLPFEWRTVTDKPLLHVLPEFVNYSSTQQIEFKDLLRIFNIEVLVAPPHEFERPSTAMLVFEIRSLERAIQVDLPMHLDLIESSYFISNPEQVARELSLELDRFEALSDQSGHVKPWMRVIELRGFVNAVEDDEQEDSPEIPVAYKLRFGSFSVDSGFHILGGTDSSNSRFPLRPFLTN